jgi:carbamoyl-phosphate synthase large subunit
MSPLENRTVLVIGSGPNVIGQSDECDQGALEACLALKQMGCHLVTVNSNPDSPITDSGLAQRAYLEPLTLETLEQIIATEKPDAILPCFGGRTALHMTVELARQGVLARHAVQVWGTAPGDLERLLDRDALRDAVAPIHLNMPSLFTFSDLDAAETKAQELGFPVVLRSDSHVMPDGVLAYNLEEIQGLAAPLKGEQLFSLSIEDSLWHWQQLEIEVLRDTAGAMRTAGAVEYLDPAVVHPGDALAVSPPQSVLSAFIDQLIDQARVVAGHLNIIGCATVRFACRPQDGSFLLLAVHPRYTRSSALTALSAGRSVARTAALLAAGLTWEKLPADGSFDPPGDWTATAVGVKWPVWDFETMDNIPDHLGPRMQAVGQAVGFGRHFKEAFQNAARGAHRDGAGLGAGQPAGGLDLKGLLVQVETPSSHRPFFLYEALRLGATPGELSQRSGIPLWFIEQFAELADLEEHIRSCSGDDAAAAEALLLQARRHGFSRGHLAQICGMPEKRFTAAMEKLDLPNAAQPLDMTGTHFFATCHAAEPSRPMGSDPVVIVLGSGPHRIGNGPDCDWALLHALRSLSELGYTPVVITNNLTGVATGFALPGRVYCNPLSIEDIQAIIAQEKPQAIITWFAGPAGNALKRNLAASGAPVAGTPIDALDLLSDYQSLRQIIREQGIPQPSSALCNSAEELRQQAAGLGYPLLASEGGPAVNSGREPISEPVMDEAMLEQYLEHAAPDPVHPHLLENFLQYAIEAQAEAVCDGESAQVTAVLEHIELAGVHAGDSALVLPPYSISTRHVETICEYTRKVVQALRVKGMINVRFAIYRDTVYLLDVGCGVTRNLSLITKTTGQPVVKSAVRLILGGRLADSSTTVPAAGTFGVRTAVFPFNVFSQIDPLLGTRMRSTGQVLVMADAFGPAYFKAQSAAGSPLPLEGSVLITVTDEDKASILEPARIFQELGFKLKATRGTQMLLAEHGIVAETVRKLGFGRPNLLDEKKNGRVQMVINTPSGEKSQMDDSFIRKAAIRYRVTHITTPASALAAAKGIAALRKGDR